MIISEKLEREISFALLRTNKRIGCFVRDFTNTMLFILRVQLFRGVFTVQTKKGKLITLAWRNHPAP